MIEVEGYQVYEDYYHEPTHAWMRIEDDMSVTIGLDDFGQKASGKIVFMDLPEIGDKVTKGTPFISIESSKWIGKINSPVSGEIIEANEILWDNPRLVNQDPYKTGWIIKVNPEKLEEELTDLITGDAIANWIKEDIKRIIIKE